MKLETLTVSQFRSLTYRQFPFAPGVNYVRGPNGCGKTSLLEAIHYLSTGRSFRANRHASCLMWGNDTFSVSGEFASVATDADDSTETLSFSYGDTSTSDRSRRQVAKRNGEFVERLSELREYLITLVFTPDEVNVLKGGPSNRRDFLDELLAMLNSNYLKILKNYESARNQRNSLLKKPSLDSTLLKQYESTLAEEGRRIVERRAELIPVLEEEVREHAQEVLDFDPDEVALRYDPDCPADQLRGLLESNRPHDLDRGHTTRGPHRDDWMIFRADRPVDRFASQGELRTLLLALKLAANSVIINRISRHPLLLLDDVESELDSTRRERILSLLHESPSQVIITGTGTLDMALLGESSDRILTLQAG